MSNKRKKHSEKDEDKENKLRKEIKRLRKRIDLQERDRSYYDGKSKIEHIWSNQKCCCCIILLRQANVVKK